MNKEENNAALTATLQERERERERVVLSELHLLRPPLDRSHF
jgi:hypothetical protein